MNNACSIAVLISGTGSNLKALIDAVDAGRLPVRIRRVISNRADAAGLGHARRAAIPHSVIGPQQHADRTAQDRAITAYLDAAQPDLVVLAGFMRILGPEIVRHFAGRMINLHPSLLPRHPGLDTYRRAIDAGDREHGSSIHFVTEGLDDGPVIAQVRVPIHPDDTPAALAARLAPRERRLTVATVELFTRSKVEQREGGAWVDGERLRRPLQLDEHNSLA